MSNQTPLPQVVVPFYDDNLIAAEEPNGNIWVAIHPITDAIGVDFSTQMRKLKNLHWATIKSVLMVAADGKVRSHFCILISRLHLWLTGINPARVRPDLREKLADYQVDAAERLYASFRGAKAGRARVEPPAAGSGDPILDAAALIGQLAGAVGDIRREQLAQKHEVAGLKTRAAATDRKVEKILKVQARARAKLDSAMPPTVPAEPLTTRKALKDLLDLWIVAHTECRRKDFRRVWRLFYRMVLRRLRIDVYARARNQGLEKLDVLEALGAMDRAYAVAKDVLDRLTGELDAEGMWRPPADPDEDEGDEDLDPEAELTDEELDDLADSWDEDEDDAEDDDAGSG